MTAAVDRATRAPTVAVAVAIALLGATAARAEPPALDLEVHGELIAGAVVTAVADRTDRRFSLERAEVTALVAAGGRATGELTVEAVRSAEPDSAAGIDGNSLLVRIKRAAIGGQGSLGRAVDLSGALGLVADPWIAALGDFPLRTFGVTVVEDQGLVASSDLGATLAVSHGDLIRLRLAVTNGEGAHQVERNQGKDTSAVVTVRPPLAALGRGALEVHGYGRDGSTGPASVRSHRAGLALIWHHPRFAAGADLVRAWGVGDRADVTAWTVEAWADVRLPRDLGLGLRWDRVDLAGPASGGDPPDRARATAGLWLELAGAVRVTAAVQVERAGAGAAIASVPTATDATRVMILAQGSFATTP